MWKETVCYQESLLISWCSGLPSNSPTSQLEGGHEETLTLQGEGKGDGTEGHKAMEARLSHGAFPFSPEGAGET